MVFGFLDSLFLQLEKGTSTSSHRADLSGAPSIDFNHAFNDKLREFEKNGCRLNERSDCFSCGYPGKILVECGLYPKHEILIMQSTLRKALGQVKGKADEAHDLTVDELYNLPQRVQNPILVISGNTHNSRLLFVDIERKGRKMLAALQVQRQSERGKYAAIVSIYSKPVDSVAMLIEEALAKNTIWHVDREKIKGFLSVTGQLQLLPRIIESLNGANIAQKNSESNTLPSKKYSKSLNSSHTLMGNGLVPESLDGQRETESEIKRETGGSDLIEVNKRFNQDLVFLSQNRLPKNQIFKLGKPSEKLIEAGVPNFEIELSASRLLSKSKQEEHKFELLELRNLPILIQNPVAVFRSATQLGAFVVMLEIEKKGEPFVVALHVKSFSNTQINSIRSIHYRKAKHLINWILKKHLLWVDKEKALNWLSKQRYNSADVGHTIKSVTNIIKIFAGANNSEQNSLLGFDDVNEQFNQDLDKLINGILPESHIFNLGYPGKRLLEAGFYNCPIELRAKTLLAKSSKSYKGSHPFNLADIKGLPQAINEPIAIFQSLTHANSRVLLVSLASNGVNFVVAVELTRTLKRGGVVVTVNDIRSLYPKDYYKDILKWIVDYDLLLWVDKEKALNWINKLRRTAEVAYLAKGATNIIKNYGFAPKNSKKNDEYNFLGLVNFSRKGSVRTYKFNGELGKFLGEYDRNRYSIVIRGDKGAGKSRLLYQLINAFAGKLYRVAFLSLEMGIHSAITQRYKSEYISPANLKRIDITDTVPDYDQLNAICKSYDVVAIDSWTKLRGMDQADFDRLQKENPNTIIISIFQSTTSKVTRGGNMPEYDASVVIHVHAGGVAECEKNRFAPTTVTYNVFTKQITSSEVVENA
ncbi:MuF-C-terminal domain-containing protein [Tenuifilum sp.]|uniref:MuF-C-terminal domain-containing protein n=1 Tax=Tenuifilum sp. TaxID=2760880 RepID=UPI00403E77B5